MHTHMHTHTHTRTHPGAAQEFLALMLTLHTSGIKGCLLPPCKPDGDTCKRSLASTMDRANSAASVGGEPPHPTGTHQSCVKPLPCIGSCCVCCPCVGHHPVDIQRGDDAPKPDPTPLKPYNVAVAGSAEFKRLASKVKGELRIFSEVVCNMEAVGNRWALI